MSKNGFTLIEILITIAIVGLMAMVIAPSLGNKKSGAERIEFFARLGSLTQLAWQNALVQNVLHKVIFDFKEKRVSLEQATPQKDATGQQKFEPVKISNLDTSVAWPEFLQVKNFFLEGFDEATRFGGSDTGKTWFFVVPDGMTQRVTINVTDSKDRDPSGRPRKIGLVLNPFNGRFAVYDTFKK